MIGRTISHYRILSTLGAGGMGVVYLAEDERLGRQVALKFLPPLWAQQQSALERFRLEARAASSLSHPGICAIYDIGQDGDSPYIVMEALKGETLRERIAKGPLKITDVLDIGIQLADALEAAHAQNIVHRDIKPANIFIGDKNRVKILDFGLAKLTASAPPLMSADTTSPAVPVASEHHMTVPGTAVGTVAYMSPEQARGEDIDARTDLFSAGAVLYEMVTGMRAFGGNSTAVIYDAILNRPPRPIAHLNPMAPPRLEAVIATMLEKDRELRCQHAADLQAELRRIRRDLDAISYVSSQPSIAAASDLSRSSSTSLPAPVVRLRRLRPLAALMVVILGGAAAGVWFWRGQGVAPDRAAVVPVEPASPPEAPPSVPSENAGVSRVEAPPDRVAEPTPVPSVPSGADRAETSPSRSQPRAQTSRPVEPARNAPDTAAVTADPAPATVTPAPSPQIPQAQSLLGTGPAPPVLPAPVAAQPPAGAAGVTPLSPAPEPPARATNPPVADTGVARGRSAAPNNPDPLVAVTAKSPVETDEAAIYRLIRTYEQAIETKNIALYRSVRPGLTPDDENVLRNSFQQIDSQQVEIRVDSLRIDARTATARIVRQDTLVTGGQRRTQASTQTLRFEKTAAGWIIAE